MNPDPNKDDSKTSTPAADPTKSENMVPITRLNEEIQKRRELESRLKLLETAAKTDEDKRLVETQNYKTLAEKREAELLTLRPLAVTAEEAEKTLQAVLAQQILELPENLRDLVPDGLSTNQKLQWLSKHKAKLTKPKGFDIGTGKQGGGLPAMSDLTPEELEIAKNFGMTPEEYAKYKS
jgi:hypothetical protein